MLLQEAISVALKAMISVFKYFGLFVFLGAYEVCKQSIKFILGMFMEFQ